MKAESLLVGRFVLSPDADNNDSTRLLINLVEKPVIPPHPDPEVVFPAAHSVVTAWPWIILEVHDGSGHSKKCLVIQFKYLAFRGAPETDLKHAAS